VDHVREVNPKASVKVVGEDFLDRPSTTIALEMPGRYALTVKVVSHPGGVQGGQGRPHRDEAGQADRADGATFAPGQG
jgi:hypothetical protein